MAEMETIMSQIARRWQNGTIAWDRYVCSLLSGSQLISSLFEGLNNVNPSQTSL